MLFCLWRAQFYSPESLSARPSKEVDFQLSSALNMCPARLDPVSSLDEAGGGRGPRALARARAAPGPARRDNRGRRHATLRLRKLSSTPALTARG